MKISKLQSRLLVQAAASGKTAQEMETLYGIPAAQCLDHIRTVLSQRDVWSELEQEQLLLFEWQRLKDMLWDRAQNPDDPISTTQLINVLKEVGRIVESRKDANERQLEKVAQLQAVKVMQFMTAAFEAATLELADKYPDVSPEELSQLYERQINSAILA